MAPTELCSSNRDDVEFSHRAECRHASQLPVSCPSLGLQALLHLPTHSFLNAGLESAVDEPFPSSFPVWSPTAQQSCSFSCSLDPVLAESKKDATHGTRTGSTATGEQEWQGGHQHRCSFNPTSVRATAALREQKHMTGAEGSRRLSNRVRTIFTLC